MFPLFLLALAQGVATAAPEAPAPAAAPPREPQAIVAAVATPVVRAGGLVLLGPAQTAQGNEIMRSRDGLFYVTAIVNGAAVRFIVDTGATIVVLTAEDARRAGVAVTERDFRSEADTANGRASMARVKLDEVRVGTSRAQAIDAAVVPRGLPVSLLGQSWLSRLSSVTINGDRMLLN